MRHLSILIIIALFFSCSRQDKKETVEVIKEPSLDLLAPKMPFILDRESIWTSLPDSLGGSNCNGRAGVTVYLDSSKYLMGFVIQKLEIIDEDGDTVINFLNIEIPIKPIMSYPTELNMYYKFLDSYIKDLDYARDEKITPKEINKISFLIRFI